MSDPLRLEPSTPEHYLEAVRAAGIKRYKPPEDVTLVGLYTVFRGGDQIGFLNRVGYHAPTATIQEIDQLEQLHENAFAENVA